MDKTLLVDTKIEDGRRLISRLVEDGFALTAAFWVKTADEGWYRLYIAPPPVPVEKFGWVFSAVYPALSKLPGATLAPLDLNPIRSDHALVQAVLETQRTHPGRIATWIRPGWSGGAEVEEVYIYPVPKPKRSAGHPFGTTKVRLKTDVEQKFREDKCLEPLTPQEAGILGQIVASGVIPAQAEYLIRKRREIDRHRPPIPAGTVVDAWITGWWGDDPKDDPNPLLEVEAPDGTAGLTFQDNTEPV